jgi:glycosyltransferase involved in cell wall biosynthesis
MRILYFSRDYTTHDHRFLSAMTTLADEVLFLRLERGPQQYEDRALPDGVRHIQWAGGTGLVEQRDGPRLVRSLRKVIRAVKPDLIQAGPIQRSALLTALAGFRPLVSMSWGYDLLHDLHRGPAWERATRFTLKRSAALIVDCDTTRDIALDYGIAPEKTVSFPWGADIQRFNPGSGQPHESPLRERRGWGPETFVLLSTRGWTDLYGVEDLVKAFVRLAPRHPELRLYMLGGGPLSGKIKSMVQRAGLIDRVHFPGIVTQENLPNYYRAADLYISTSHSDGTSISLLEALASGTPVLLSDIPGNQEWVQGYPGDSASAPQPGWLFPDGDDRALEAAIQHALEQRSQRPTLSHTARQLAEARGDWEKNFPKLGEAWRMAQEG